MKRDFTYVDDIVLVSGSIKLKMKKHHKVYNLGNKIRVIVRIYKNN